MQKPFGFVQNKLRLHERFVANVLPADFALGINKKCAVQREILEVIVAAVRLEDFERFIRNQRERKLFFAILFLRELQVFDGVGADGNQFNPLLAERFRLRCECL